MERALGYVKDQLLTLQATSAALPAFIYAAIPTAAIPSRTEPPSEPIGQSHKVIKI